MREHLCVIDYDTHSLVNNLPLFPLYTTQLENDLKNNHCHSNVIQDHAAASLSNMTTDCTWTKLILLLLPSDLTAQNKHDATTQQSSKHDNNNNNNNKETEQYSCILERIDRIDRIDKIDKIDKNSLLTGHTKSGASNS